MSMIGRTLSHYRVEKLIGKGGMGEVYRASDTKLGHGAGDQEIGKTLTSRFSKIAGEMVPHGRVEEALQRALGSPEEQVFAVTSIADPRKGESLAVVHTCDPDSPS